MDQRSFWARFGKLLRRVPLGMIPYLVFLLVIVVLVICAPLLSPHDPAEATLRSRLLPPVFTAGGTSDYLLGTDVVGRDILSRVLYGGRVSLIVGVFGVLVGAVVGITVGLVAGYSGGAIDEVMMTVTDIQLAFPHILLAIAIIAVLGPSLVNLTLVVGLSGWVTYARIARGVTLQMKEREFIEAVKCIGGSNVRILLRHILPNTMSSIIVLATLDLARIIILESTLSFLGLGVQPPTPSWGGMIREGRAHLETAWWIVAFPGMALLGTAMSVSRIGDWLRDILDPTMPRA